MAVSREAAAVFYFRVFFSVDLRGFSESGFWEKDNSDLGPPFWKSRFLLDDRE